MQVSTAIFWPAIVLALATLLLYVPMFRSRVGAVRRGEAKARDFKLRTHEPDASRPFVNAITNQYETPVLFYAVCAFAFVSGSVSGILLALAWIYAVAKLVQIGILVSSNRLQWRMGAFAVALVSLVLMWIVFAVNLALA